MFMHVLLCMVLCSSVYSTQNTLIDVASRLGASICVKYLNATGLATAFTYNGSSSVQPILNGSNIFGNMEIIRDMGTSSHRGLIVAPGNFTLFCPTDAAFSALPADVKTTLSNEPDLLRQVLMFHAVDSPTFSSQLFDGMMIHSLVQGADIRVNVYTVNGQKIVTVSGSSITLADQPASNGVLHLIGRVMFPLSLDNAVQYLAKTPDLGTLLYSVAETTLPGVLQGDGPFTIFAPNNAAFNKLRPGYWSDLFNKDYTGYINLLKYHVVSGVYYSKGLTSGTLQTLAGKSITINTKGGVMVNNATVVKADQTIKNGVVHIIDTVLIYE